MSLCLSLSFFNYCNSFSLIFFFATDTSSDRVGTGEILSFSIKTAVFFPNEGMGPVFSCFLSQSPHSRVFVLRTDDMRDRARVVFSSPYGAQVSWSACED